MMILREWISFVGKMNPNRIENNCIRSSAEYSKNPTVRTYIFLS